VEISTVHSMKLTTAPTRNPKNGTGGYRRRSVSDVYSRLGIFSLGHICFVDLWVYLDITVRANTPASSK
jgi:hypothetical protein